MRAINIIWDVDDIRDLEFLPNEVKIPEYVGSHLEEISDYIFDVIGYRHKGFELTDCGKINDVLNYWDEELVKEGE